MLGETLAEAARRFGDKEAVVCDAVAERLVLTYGALDTLADEVAAGLLWRGVREGDVVALVMPALPEHLVAYAAASRMGAVTAAVNARLAPAERRAVLELVRPALVLGTQELLEDQGVPGGAEVVEVEPATAPESLLGSLRRSGEVPPPLAPDDDRPVVIVHTSGTTGTPKGALFCNRQLRFITYCDVGSGWGGGGPTLAGPALAHLGPMTKLAGAWQRGVTQHLMSSWQAADALVRLAELKVSSLGGVPTQVALLLRQPDFDAYDLSSIRTVVMGGGPASPALVREARRRFAAPVGIRYSCTEAGIGTGTSFGDPEEDAEVSVGRPHPGVSVTVLGPDGTPLEPGEVGEVCLASPAVMEGYVGDEEATAQAMAGRFGVRTGDLGYLDPQGRLRLAGRVAERYVRGGYNVYPMEVEAVLGDHPDVASLVVVGRPDPVMGEVGVAVVVAKPGRAAPSLEALRSLGADRLARYKLPDDLVEVEALPLTAMEKVDRRALAALVARDATTR